MGSNVLTRADGRLDITRMSSLVDQVAWLRGEGYEVVLVSSGAVAAGRGEAAVGRKLDSVGQRQLYSALGQAKLINLYYGLFREYKIPVGQVLTMKENFASRREYLNQRACMSVMLDNGVLPIVNENDTVSVTELMFTDNDELSDGIYDGSPGDGASRLITRVVPGADISRYVRPGKSSFGRGGMMTKCGIARRAADEGIRVIIANGKREGVLRALFESPATVPHTEFVPAVQPVPAVKKWIAHSGSFAKGVVRVDAEAAGALRGSAAVSLLPVGVTAVEGDFYEGDIISIVDGMGAKIALGCASCGSAEARAAMGKRGLRPLVHYDYMYME